jgi:signal transduction histidine kinase/CheY-like chemotaxis protein
MTRPEQPGFTTYIARSFLLLALITVYMVGTVAFVRGREALKQAAYSRLQVTATLKEQEINRWLESCEEDFLLIAEFPSVKQNIQTLLDSPPNSAAYEASYARLSAYFAEIGKKKPKFTNISIQNRANQIVLSTDPTLEGKYEIATNLTELESVVSGETFAPIFYVSPKTGKPAITYSTKIYDAAGDRQGMILADLKLKRIDDIISERTGLDRTGETYLVGSLANKNAFISRGESADTPTDNPHSEAIDAAFRAENGAALYDNYLGQPVIGVYRWLADQDLALLAEMSQTEAFAPARSLAATIMLVGLGAAGVLLLGVNRLARQLSVSRQQIENYSQQLEQTANAANAANRAKSEFLANMSHELRTPLNAILGFTQLMQRSPVNEASQSAKSGSQSDHKGEYLGIISRSGEHLLNLINDVLSMAKIEAGRTTFDPVDFDLRYLLLSLEEMLRMKAEAKALQLFVEVGESVPQFIKTDEIKLRQVLVNLVGNAIKFTRSGRVTLAVKMTPAPYRIAFAVQDTGPGIAAEELAHLFDPFYQASRTRKAQQGTGLGLTISQRFVGLMGGEITAQSELGKGSTFSFEIQAQPADSTDLSASIGEVMSLAPGEAYRILVVEDVYSARRLLVDLLAMTGFQVKAVSNGEQAIACYQSWHPHLIWMDMRMPVMDGYEATRRIRALQAARLQQRSSKDASQHLLENSLQHSPSNLPPAVPQNLWQNSPKDLQNIPTKIIALTASAFEEERSAVLTCGCDDLVRKPFHTQTIFEKIAEHIGAKYLYKDSLKSDLVIAIPTVSPRDAGEPVFEPISNKRDFASLLKPDDLSVMPSAWLAQFHQAALEVDAEKLHQLIRQIPAEHSHLAETLSSFTRNFCFDELIVLTQTHV